MNQCLPIKKHKVRKRDLPWVTAEVRRRQRRLRRTYKREGRSGDFYSQRNELDELIANSKKRFMDKVKEKAKKSGNSSGFFQAAKSLQSKEAPVIWDIKKLFPNLSNEQISEIVATFFNSISSEYTPIARPTKKKCDIKIEAHEISSRLRHCKKPKSRVQGDIPPALVAQNADSLAINTLVLHL